LNILDSFRFLFFIQLRLTAAHRETAQGAHFSCAASGVRTDLHGVNHGQGDMQQLQLGILEEHQLSKHWGFSPQNHAVVGIFVDFRILLSAEEQRSVLRRLPW